MVSIIVPVYNAEKYIEKCVDSLTGQSLKDTEIILVDDGSSDSSLAMMQRFAEVDSRIVVLSQPNSGALTARKKGASAANGDYIAFVDSDDWVDSDMYATLYKCAKDYAADFVSSGYFFEGNYISEHIDDLEHGFYSEKDMDRLREEVIFNSKNRSVGIRGSLCTKLFKRELILKVFELVPDALSFSEDKMCILTCSLYANSAYILDKSYYHYIKHDTSFVNTIDVDYLSKVQSVYLYVRSLYAHPHFTDTMRAQAELYITELLYKGINSRMGFANSNLLWIDPYYLEKLKKDARVLLYGVGALTHTYLNQLKKRQDIRVIGIADYDKNGQIENGMRVVPPTQIDSDSYDLILITVKNRAKAMTVREHLLLDGVPEEKICWFDQTEIFWRFADANGWFDE